LNKCSFSLHAGIGVGTTSVCFVHRWPHLTNRKSRPVTTPLRRRHTGVRLLSACRCWRTLSVDLRVHGCRRQLDEAQQTTAKRRQNGSSVVSNWSATTPTPQRHTDDRRHSCFRVVIRPRPRNTYRRRSGDADPCSENCVVLLRRPPSAASNSSLSATAYVPVAGGHSSKHAT